MGSKLDREEMNSSFNRTSAKFLERVSKCGSRSELTSVSSQINFEDNNSPIPNDSSPAFVLPRATESAPSFDNVIPTPSKSEVKKHEQNKFSQKGDNNSNISKEA